MSKRWKWFLPGYLLALPGTLVGLLLALYYRPARWYWSDGCIEAALPTGRNLIGGSWVGAQTFGTLIFYRTEKNRMSSMVRVHERCHVVQAMVLTAPLFIVTYAIHFLWEFLVVGEDFENAYLSIWAERQAYGRQNNINGWGVPNGNR